MTLDDDFAYWWRMEKYKNASIPARQFKDAKVKLRHGSNAGWPGTDRRVKYWVELDNGYAVGIVHFSDKDAIFPFSKMKP